MTLSALVAVPAAVANAPIVEDAPVDVVVTDVGTSAPAQPAESTAVADEPPPPPAAPSEPQPAPEEPVAATPPPAPPIVPDAPAEAPVEPVVAMVEPPPAPAAAVAELPPPPPSAPHEATIRTPPAPQEPTAADVKEPLVGGAVTQSIATPNTSPEGQLAEPAGLGMKTTAPVTADGTPASSTRQPHSSPLVAPIVQRLLPTPVPFTDGYPSLGHNAMASGPASTVERTSPIAAAEASHVQSQLVIAGYIPGGGSRHSAGLLAMLMGLLPLGLPDGKFSMSAETQLGLLLLGALIVVIPFFAAPIRDRRRRGPRGFATLALRPG